jgi:type II secretory pathway component PulK
VTGRRGIAQLLVLWALVLLGTLAMGFSLSMRTEAQAARNGVDDVRAYFQARTGVMRTVALLSTAPPDNVMRMAITGEEGDASYEVRVESEAGKVDINLVQDEVLLSILRNGGLPDDEAESVRDAILDWRDPDDTPRPRGAEWPDYARLPEPVQPRDANFGDVGELRYVKGVTPEFYRRFLSRVFTAHGNAPQVSYLYAPEIVLRSLPGVSPEAAAEIVARREADFPLPYEELVAIAAGGRITAEGLALITGRQASTACTITATGKAGGAVHAVRCLAEVAAGRKKGVKILRWLDQAPREVEG